MDFKQFLKDNRPGPRRYTTQEAATFLRLNIGRVRTLIRCGILKPASGGGRGVKYYFTLEELDALNEKVREYRW